ncbi:MAG: hypothetical protein PVH00_08875 [Gemmatimonadota bacterium]
MAISYMWNEELQLITIVASGVLTGAEVVEMRENMNADPRLGFGIRELVDVRDVTELRVNSADIDLFLSMDEVYGERVTSRMVAILATSDSTFGMARMYEMRSGRDDRVSVFRDEAEARAWLGNGVASVGAITRPTATAR